MNYNKPGKEITLTEIQHDCEVSYFILQKQSYARHSLDKMSNKNLAEFVERKMLKESSRVLLKDGVAIYRIFSCYLNYYMSPASYPYTSE